MKKLYALLSATILTGFAGFAQVEIRANEGGQVVGNDISGTTVMLTVNPNVDSSLVVRTFTVTNVSGNEQDLRIKRLRIVEVPGWEDGLCWGPNPDPQFVGQCFPASAMTTNPWTTPNVAEMANAGNGNIVVDVHTNQINGCGHYRYYVMNGNFTIDSIDVEVCSTLSLDEPKAEPAMTAYPNPANNYLNINTTGIDGNCTLRITDVLGKVVYSEEVGPLKKVDVSDFKNGVYLVTVLDRGQVIQTRRVVIKHQ